MDTLKESKRFAVPMIARVWRTVVKAGQFEEYERFAKEISLPMFRRQEGFQGVLFLRGEQECLVVSFWRDQRSVERLERSRTYWDTVERILQEGFLEGNQHTTMFHVQGSFLELAPWGAASIQRSDSDAGLQKRPQAL